MYRCPSLLLPALSALLFTGCAPAGPTTYPVSGKVTWNGQPLPDGFIIFEAPDGSLTPAAGKITDGAYDVRVQAGSKKVQIRADRETGQRDPVMNTIAREPYIPARYNSATILEADVAPSANSFDFDLRDAGKE